MTKRITSATELRQALEIMKKGERLTKVISQQKHIAGDWNLDHLQDQLIQLLLVFKQNAVIFINYEANKQPVSLFAGMITEDWACGKLGLNEIAWVTVDKSQLGGVKVLQAVENLIKELNIDFLSCNYMCNGGDPRVQAFYLNNGFRLDTLTFVKNYK
jgi:hypothetical protein